MKKIYLFTGVLLLMSVLSLLSCASRRSEPVKQAKFATRQEDVANGERVYMAFCQKCHPAGEAGLGPSISANPAPQFLKRFQVRHGLGVMPAFSRAEISKSDLRDLSKYLQSWKEYSGKSEKTQ